jgi:hypothetical protein
MRQRRSAKPSSRLRHRHREGADIASCDRGPRRRQPSAAAIIQGGLHAAVEIVDIHDRPSLAGWGFDATGLAVDRCRQGRFHAHRRHA